MRNEEMNTERALDELGLALDCLWEDMGTDADTCGELSRWYERAASAYPSEALGCLIELTAIAGPWLAHARLTKQNRTDWAAFMRCLSIALAHVQHDALTESFSMGALCSSRNQIIKGKDIEK